MRLSRKQSRKQRGGMQGRLGPSNFGVVMGQQFPKKFFIGVRTRNIKSNYKINTNRFRNVGRNVDRNSGRNVGRNAGRNTLRHKVGRRPLRFRK